MKILHFQFQLLVHVFSMVLVVYNVTDIQGFGVEYVVVFAKKNNNYVETKMGIVKKAFWAVVCSNFIAYLSEWHFC